MRILNRCPHCRERAIARSSREMSPTFREITFRCDNEKCCHWYVANMEFSRTLSPSLMPDPALDLPMSPHVEARLAKQRKPTD
jgi:hypothetical protein